MKKNLFLIFFFAYLTSCSHNESLISGVSNEHVKSLPNNNSGSTLWQSFLIFHRTNVANHQKLINDKATVILRMEKLTKLDEESAEIPEKQLMKLDAAEKSIRLKQSKEALNQYIEELNALYDTYGFPFHNLLNNAYDIAETSRKKGDQKLNFTSPSVVNKAFIEIEDIENANYKPSQPYISTLVRPDASPFIRPSCIGDDKRFNKNCIKDWINACSKTYKSEDEKLYLEGVDEEWTISRFKVTHPSEYPLFMFNKEQEMSEQKQMQIINLWGYGLIYNACGWLASQGYDFDYTGELFPIFDSKNLYPEELSDNSKDLNADNFHKVFNPNPDKIIKNINILSSKPRFVGALKDISLIIKRRIELYKKNIQEVCSHVGRTFDKFAIYYTTEACEVRATTKYDLEMDLKSWEDNQFITEAIKQGHLNLKQRVELCEAASNNGYLWKFTAPEPDKYCKRSKNNKQ